MSNDKQDIEWAVERVFWWVTAIALTILLCGFVMSMLWWAAS